MPSLFSDSLNLAGTPQERAESMQGRAIVEASELAGVTKADIASLKTFLSRIDDGNVRLSVQTQPRIDVAPRYHRRHQRFAVTPTE